MGCFRWCNPNNDWNIGLANKKEPLIIFGFLFFLSAFDTTYRGVTDNWWSAWAIMLAGCSLYFCFQISKKFHWPVALSFLWVMLTGIYTFAWYDNQYYYLKDQTFIVLRMHSAYATFAFLSLSMVAYYFADKTSFLYSIAILCFINGCLTVFQFLKGNDFLHIYGFWGNGTINGSLIAFTYPLLFACPNLKRYNWIKFIIFAVPIAAIFASQTSVPVGTLVAGLCTYSFLSIKSKKKYILITIIIICLFGLGYILGGPGQREFFSTSNRYTSCMLVLKEFFKHGNIWIGQGPGSFNMFGPLIQIRNNYLIGQWLIWLHQDWIQSMFETGVIGLFLYLIMTGYAIYYGIKREEHIVTSCFVAWIACAFVNYPMHYPLHCFCGMVFLARLTRRRYA